MRLSEFILFDLEAILQDWERFAASAREPAQMIDKQALRDHAKTILEVVATDLTDPQTELTETESLTGQSDLLSRNDSASTPYGTRRMALGRSLNATIAEYRALRASVIRRWQISLLGNPVSDTEIRDLIRFNEVIDQSISDSANSYVLENDQRTRAFDAVLSFLPDLSFILTLEGRFAYANKATTQLFALSLKQLVGNRFVDIDLANGVELQRQVDRVIFTKRQCRGEVCYPSQSDQCECYEYLFAPILNQDGAVEAVIGTAYNMTARKAKEDAVFLRHPLLHAVDACVT